MNLTPCGLGWPGPQLLKAPSKKKLMGDVIFLLHSPSDLWYTALETWKVVLATKEIMMLTDRDNYRNKFTQELDYYDWVSCEDAGLDIHQTLAMCDFELTEQGAKDFIEHLGFDLSLWSIEMFNDPIDLNLHYYGECEFDFIEMRDMVMGYISNWLRQDDQTIRQVLSYGSGLFRLRTISGNLPNLVHEIAHIRRYILGLTSDIPLEDISCQETMHDDYFWEINDELMVEAYHWMKDNQ